MDEQESVFKPPYLSFQTFWNFIGELSKKPLPPQIDRSLLSSKSGTDQLNLTSTLKSFALIRDDLSVEPRLDQLVNADEDQRKKLLAEIVHQYYPDPLRVSAENGTEKLLHDSFRESYGLDAADTRRKSITFFLHAARTADIELSPHFPATRTGSGGGGSPRPRKASSRKPKPPVQESPRTGAVSGGETKTVGFGEAGTVTVNVNMQWLKLSPQTMVKLRKAIDTIEELGTTLVVETEGEAE